MHCFCAGNCSKVLNCPNEPAIYMCLRCWSDLVCALYRVIDKAPTPLKDHTQGLLKVFHTTCKNAPEAKGYVKEIAV